MRLIILFVVLCSISWGWIVISNNPYDQRQSAVAFLNNQYLVTWADARAYQIYQASVIYGSRVSVNGAVINPNGMVVNAGNPDRLMPKACAGISNWLVIWHEGC